MTNTPVIRKDGDKFSFAGHPASLMSANKPYSYCEQFGKSRFELRNGDVSLFDQADSPGTTKERCMAVLDRKTGTRGFDVPIFARCYLEIEPGEGSSMGWGCTLIQLHNSADAGEPWPSPPVEFTLKVINGVEVFDIAHRTVAKKLISGNGDISTIVLEGYKPVPMVRDHDYVVDIAYQNGQGLRQGYLRVTLDGNVIYDYEGVTGYNDDGGTYMSAGLYRQGPAGGKVQPPLVVKFHNFGEGVDPTP